MQEKTTPEFDVVIAGGGHGGAQSAIALRQEGFEGSIAIFGEEVSIPYERPPLSKDFLARDKPFERILLRPEEFWKQKDIELGLGSRIEKVDPRRKEVVLQDGSAARYSNLVWATGGSAKRLSCPGGKLENVFSVRALPDVEAIWKQVDAGAGSAVVFGGGYIGLKATATLRKLGVDVTLLENADRVLARVAGGEIARFFETQHRDYCVDVRLGTQLQEIEGGDRHATSVRLADSTLLPCDFVIVGIGIEPEIGPLRAAGIEAKNGVVVNEHRQTSEKDIFAVGDCAAHPNRFADGRMIRPEPSRMQTTWLPRWQRP